MNRHVDKLLAQLVLVILAFVLLAAAGRAAWRVGDDLAYVESLRATTTSAPYAPYAPQQPFPTYPVVPPSQLLPTRGGNQPAVPPSQYLPTPAR